MRFDIQRLHTQLSLMNHFCFGAILVSSLMPLSAAELRPVQLRSVCFQHVNDVKKLFVVSGGENPKATEFDLYTTVISDVVETSATDGVLTFAMADGVVDGKPKYKTVATAKAASGAHQLAIFIPGEGEGSPYRCFVIDDSEGNFPMGSTMAVNLSTVPFRISIGEHLKAVNPGKIENIPMAKKANDRGQVSVIISIADPAGESGWRAVNQTRWFTGTDKRDLAIGFIHPKTKQPTVNCYGDTPPWLQKQ
jgi:hypothetical protein